MTLFGGGADRIGLKRRRVAGGAPGMPPFDYNPALATMTVGMRKSLPPAGPFASAPIVQGRWDGSGTPDVVSFPRGTLFGNAVGYAYTNIDPYQGTISFWITPEWAGNDGIRHDVIYCSSTITIYKGTDSLLSLYIGSSGTAVVQVDVSAWVAGTTYHVVGRWDSKRALDGTNYACLTLNNVHTYGMTTAPTIAYSPGTISVGGLTGAAISADSLVQGLVISRRGWTDSGGYGDDVGNGTGANSEISQVYNAGAGRDWALVHGSWDIVFGLPTNSTVGALTTSALEAWSHPHLSSVPDVTFMSDGGYLGGPFAVGFNGAAYANCGSGATLDNLGAGGAIFQMECWFRHDTYTAGTYVLVSKGWGALTGWALYINTSGYLTGVVDLVTTDSTPSLATSVRDGKWHHGVLSYNDTTKAGYVALDGVWSAVSTGAGNYVNDDALSLFMGRRADSAASYHNGGLGWLRLHNHAHYTPLTNFVPPCANPGSDAETVERWDADEGTGGTLAAHVTTPANDGALTNCTWSAVWNQQGSPVVPTSLQFAQQNDGIDFLSPAALDDLPLGDMTIEFFARIPRYAGGYDGVISKSAASLGGWLCYMDNGNNMRLRVYHAGDDANIAVLAADNRWHHWAMDWKVATLTLRVFKDGIYQGTSTATGAYDVDNTYKLLVNGRSIIGTADFTFAIGAIRISNVRRYTGLYFCPPARVDVAAVWTLPDANTLLQCAMTEGAGATVTDSSATGANGTITFGAATKWLNTPDMAQDSPSARVYNWGYNIGSNAAGDGLTIRDIAVTAEKDYVVRVVCHNDVRSQGYLQFWDMIGAAQIGADYFLPRRYGQHTGANNSATLICATGYFWQQLVGWRLYNITDGSATTITAVSGDRTTITGVLAGGTDNDWDTNDYYMLMPPTGKHESQYPYGTETIHVIRTPVGCTSMEMRLINNSTGVCSIHQFEVG